MQCRVPRWESLRDALIKAWEGEAVEVARRCKRIDVDSGETARVARGLPEPRAPTAAERARHNLNNWQYKIGANIVSHAGGQTQLTEHLIPQTALCPSLLRITVLCVSIVTTMLLLALLVKHFYLSRTVYVSPVLEKSMDDDAAIKYLKIYLLPS